MKSFIIPFLFISLSPNAQIKEGTLVFERTVQMPQRMMNINNEISRELPRSRTDQFELLFSDKKTLWQFLPNAAEDGESGTFAGGGMVIRVMGGTNDISFYNFEKGLKTDQREVMERTFIVSDSIRKLNWKLTEETKTILDHKAFKAVATRIGERASIRMENGEMKREMIADTATIIAWFTTEIPVPGGPADFQGQLPGMILEMDINKGQTVYKAIEFSTKVSTSKIKEPKDGKKVTASEFVAERDKLMEEMRKNAPARGNVIRM